MRPLELRISGFRSYPASGASFDFRRRRLLAVVGPIGSGKTTVLDAMSFALYGRTPRIGRDTKSLVHQRSDGCLVSLRFGVGGEIWQAERALRRNGQSQHKLFRLSDDSAEAEVVEAVTQARAVAVRVEEILGMDFDAFQRTVLLAQGQFARFLEMGPTERDTLLKAILGYQRVDLLRAAAKDRVTGLAAALAATAARLEAVAEAEVSLRSVRAEAETAGIQKERLAALAEDVAALDHRVAAAQEKVRSAAERHETLAGLASRLPSLEDAAALADRLAAVEAETAAAAALLAEARAEVEARKTRVDGLETLRATARDAGEALAKFEPLSAALCKASAREAEASTVEKRTRERLSAVSEEAAAATHRAAAAADSVGAARRALDEARHSETAAERADMAGVLAEQLVSGEACPVCGRVVTATPETTPRNDVTAAHHAVMETSAALVTAEAAQAGADTDTAEAKAALAAATAAVVAAESRRVAAAADVVAARRAVTEVEAELTGLLGDGEPGELLAVMTATIAQADADLEEGRSAEKAAQQAYEESTTARRSLDSRLAETAAQAAAVGAQIGVEVDLTSPTPSLLDTVSALHEGWDRRKREADAALQNARQQAAAAENELRVLLDEHGISETYERAMARLEQRVDDLQRRIAELETRAAAGEDLTAERLRLTEEHGRFETLVADMVDSKFVAFLLETDRTALIEVAATHFDRLSSGRYRFQGDRDLTVVDATAPHSGRSPDSLSGGETFLAALALALALADMVSREGAARDAFLLDEGFGTLDAEHLDLAMDGIESLVDGDERRLVVVVSHRPEVKDRIGDVIELDKDPVTGDTVVRRT